ncbi:MAG TPA: TVP38/TMEM64 family protein [Thermoanaerobaculia bacterium]|jgi:uncharacterized membrane protein YdjX (TVP38/TMEM64 family)|nr:TVP38/TMEM64 family protein [Thermoanaerobaculia bacterium]
MAEPDSIAPAAPDAPAALEARAAGASHRRGRGWLKLLVAAAVVVALVLAGRQLGGVVAEGARRIQGLGAWAPLAFVAAYALGAVAFVPGSVLTLAGGALFGLWRGTLYVFAGATLGACAAFLVARYLARRAVERRIARNPRFAAVDRAVALEGRKIVFLLRLSPVFPFNLLNYALGLTRVRFADYAVASLGMLPGTILYVYYGKVLGDVARVAGGVGAHRDAGYWSVLALGLLATVAVTIVVTRTARRALNQEIEHAGP